MKIRTENHLLAKLDDEFAWRRKELSAVWSDVQIASEKCRNARIRAAVALLYAHWEGFIKVAGDSYVQFVAVGRLNHEELEAGFLSLALRQRLSEFSGTTSVEGHIDFLTFLQSGMGSRARLPQMNIIKTGSNLNSKRLREIVFTLGFDYSDYVLKENLIDKKLIEWRNSIAHGKFTCPTQDEFNLLYEEITKMLRLFKNQVENAVSLKTYRRHDHRSSTTN